MKFTLCVKNAREISKTIFSDRILKKTQDIVDRIENDKNKCFIITIVNITKLT